MRRKPAPHTWFLPLPGHPDPEPRWRVVFRLGTATFPLEVCAPDAETAAMRAGMKRAGVMERGKQMAPSLCRSRWERESLTQL